MANGSWFTKPVDLSFLVRLTPFIFVSLRYQYFLKFIFNLCLFCVIAFYLQYLFFYFLLIICIFYHLNISWLLLLPVVNTSGISGKVRQIRLASVPRKTLYKTLCCTCFIECNVMYYIVVY
jgi:hypothetical protein